MNTLSSRKAIKQTLAGVLVMVGVVFFYHGVLAIPPAEPAGCANDTCKDTTYFIKCDANNQPEYGVVFDRLDCLNCKVNGRCENGTTKTCTPTDNNLNFAVADVTEICQCAKAPASTYVEGSLVKQTGTFKDTKTKQRTCQ